MASSCVLLPAMHRLLMAGCRWMFAILALGLAFGTTALLPCDAQVFTAANPGRGTLPLDGPWFFRTGDNPAWAKEKLPRSELAGWKPIRPDSPWGKQGYAAYTGYAWYRAQVDIGPGTALSLLIPSVDDVYELFWNGEKLGEYAAMPPHAVLLNAQHVSVFSLPADSSKGSHGVLALRVWKAQLASNDPATLGGLNGAPLLGDPAMLELVSSDDRTKDSQRFFVRTIISSVVLVFGLISLLVYLRGTRKPIYFWLAIYLAVDSSTALINIFRWFSVTLFESQCLNGGRSVVCNLALWFILLHLFKMAGEKLWRRTTLLLFYIDLALEVCDCATMYFWQHANPLLPLVDGITTAGYTLIPIYFFVLLGFGLKKRRHVDFWPLAVSLSVYGLYQIVIDGASQGARFTGVRWAELDQWTFPLGPYPVGARVLLDIFFLITLLLTVERQQRAERQQQNQLEQEIQSAREIQRLLVSIAFPQVSGFVVEAAYQPAQEVGGDFFQIIPKGGGMLVVLGDVSGKGLKAAMTVSLIVGTIQTLAETSDSPASLLTGLNRRLHGGTAEGFSTCLALRVDPDGSVTVANAGHLAPFLNDVELAIEGSLPLGLVHDLVYEESTVYVGHGDRMTLFTDGLLEAQNESRELYGFSRLQKLMSQLPSVQSMLQAAITFGQEDDITILTLTRS